MPPFIDWRGIHEEVRISINQERQMRSKTIRKQLIMKVYLL
jgi:hypothetical protein